MSKGAGFRLSVRGGELVKENSPTTAGRGEERNMTKNQLVYKGVEIPRLNNPLIIQVVALALLHFAYLIGLLLGHIAVCHTLGNAVFKAVAYIDHFTA